MSNARFTILQARAVKDTRITDAQFRTLAALGMYADQDGWCFPSLTTIGDDLGKTKQAVGRDTIALKKLGYLDVYHRHDKKTGGRRSNLYRLRFDFPVVPSQLTVDAPSTPEVDAPSTPEVDVNVPSNVPSNAQRDSDIKATMPLDWQLAAGGEISPEALELARLNIEAINSFERSLGFGSLPWASTPTWEKLHRFVLKVYRANPDIFVQFQAWRNDKKGGMYRGWTNGKIRQNPQLFIDGALPEFEASRMYAEPVGSGKAL
jgi:hypothetical protein